MVTDISSSMNIILFKYTCLEHAHPILHNPLLVTWSAFSGSMPTSTAKSQLTYRMSCVLTSLPTSPALEVT